MNVKILFLVSCALITTTTMHAMIQDIPKLSFEKIETYVKELKQKQYTRINNQLSKSLSFNVAMLPAELRCRIIINMFDGNKELANIYYKTPLIYVSKKYYQTRSTALQSFLSKKKTEQLTIELFMLPTHPTKIIFNALNPSFMTKLIYDGPVISETTLTELKNYKSITNKIFKNRNILVINELAEKSPVLFYIMALSILATTTVLTVFPLSCPLVGVICQFTSLCPTPFDHVWFTFKLIGTISTFYAPKIASIMKSEGRKLTL